MNTKFTTPQAIAEALRSLADRLDALPATELPGVNVQVKAHIFQGASVAERVHAIDLLSFGLAGECGQHDGKSDDNGGIHYGLPCFTASPEGITTSTVTIIDRHERDELQRLWPQADSPTDPLSVLSNS